MCLYRPMVTLSPLERGQGVCEFSLIDRKITHPLSPLKRGYRYSRRYVTNTKYTGKSSFMIQDTAGYCAIPRRSAGTGQLKYSYHWHIPSLAHYFYNQAISTSTCSFQLCQMSFLYRNSIKHLTPDTFLYILLIIIWLLSVSQVLVRISNRHHLTPDQQTYTFLLSLPTN